jgi:iron-sulfur cluster repair protein YtfE (RIC family)
MTAQASSSTAAGLRMVAQLRMAHTPLRTDLAQLGLAIAMLEEAVLATEPVREIVAGLTVGQFAWQIQTRCEYFCDHLSLHHGIEDERMLPVLQRQFPELTPVIMRLRNEHEQVSMLILEIGTAARELRSDDPETVDRLRNYLEQLATLLAGHLDYEESSLFPYFERMTRDWHHG